MTNKLNRHKFTIPKKKWIEKASTIRKQSCAFMKIANIKAELAGWHTFACKFTHVTAGMSVAFDNNRN